VSYPSRFTVTITFQVRCSRCGRELGQYSGDYSGEPFWVEGFEPREAKVLCSRCKLHVERV